MKTTLLEHAVKHDTTEILKPVVQAAYSLTPIPSLELTQIAADTNQKLGFELFDDLRYPQLVLDFSRIARAVALNALANN